MNDAFEKVTGQTAVVNDENLQIFGSMFCSRVIDICVNRKPFIPFRQILLYYFLYFHS